MEVKLAADAAVIKIKKMRGLIITLVFWILLANYLQAQELETKPKETRTYKKRVLESIEVDILSSYYNQDGGNAAVSGGIGTELLDDATGTIIISVPINSDDILSINAGISAYSSASSSNVDPFDGRQAADPFIASSGESIADVWSNVTMGYAHSSDDRNQIFSGNLSFSQEYDYSSIGIGGSFSHLFNKKNTEVSLNASAFFDNWTLLHPAELRPFGLPGEEDDDEYENFNIDSYTITGNANYNPIVAPMNQTNRNSYALGLGFSQILSKRLQASLAFDLVMQNGLLSTPFQRVYFQDVEDSFIENFHLADDIERLPSSRTKAALGVRLNYYANEFLSVRSFYRHYRDSWRMTSNTVSIEAPIKFLMGQITLYPSYRFYQQASIEFFAPYNKHLSTQEFYTSDNDLSSFSAHQVGIGASYNNIFGTKKLWLFEFKSIDLKYYKYQRNIPFSSNLITIGIKFKL